MHNGRGMVRRRDCGNAQRFPRIYKNTVVFSRTIYIVPAESIVMPRDESKYNIIIHELIRKNSEDTRRLRSIEQRLDMIENRMSSLEAGSLERAKKFSTKTSEAETSLKALGDEISRLKNSLEKINRQINKFARKRDIKEMEKMMDLLNPVNEESEKLEERSFAR